MDGNVWITTHVRQVKENSQ